MNRLNKPRKHVVVKLAHSFVVGVWSSLAAMGALLVSPVLAVFEIPAMRRYVRMETM